MLYTNDFSFIFYCALAVILFVIGSCVVGCINNKRTTIINTVIGVISIIIISAGCYTIILGIKNMELYKENKINNIKNEIVLQVNNILEVDDTIVLNISYDGYWEIKSDKKVYRVYLDNETNKVISVLNIGDLYY